MKGVATVMPVLVSMPDAEQMDRMLTFAASAFVLRRVLPRRIQITVPRVHLEAWKPCVC